MFGKKFKIDLNILHNIIYKIMNSPKISHKIIFKVLNRPRIKFKVIRQPFELQYDINKAIHRDIQKKLDKFKSYNIKIDDYSYSKSK